MKKSLLPYLTIALLTAEVQASAAPQAGLCPSEINPTSIELRGISSVWKSNVAKRLRWDAATFLGSPPEQKAFLQPETRTLTKSTWAEIYLVGAPEADGNWIQCSYGEGDEVTLARRIDDSLRRCTVTYKQENSKDVPVEVTCK